MIIESNVPKPKTDKIDIDLKLHNMSAMVKYHANELHNTGRYDEKDVYHTNEAYKATIAVVRFARTL